jgi:DNA-binding FadR family transcriptional regulator
MDNNLNRVSLSEQVAAELEKEFKELAYAPGAKLPSEPQLTLRFNVSRTVIREALKYLQAKGLVEIHQGKGTVFLGYDEPGSRFNLFKKRYHKPDSLELDQAFQTGEVIFHFTIKFVLKNITEKDIQKLRTLTAAMKNAPDQKQLNESYFKFMLRLAAIGNNPLNMQLMQTQVDYFKVANEILLTASEQTGFMAEYAEAVVDALEARDEQKILARYRQLQDMNRDMLNYLIGKPVKSPPEGG